MDVNMSTFQVELTTEQLNIIENSLELYSRVLAGQFEEVGNVIKWETSKIYDINGDEVAWEKLHEFIDVIRNAKPILGMPPNANHGIHSNNINDKARKAYDICKVLAYHRHWDEKGETPNDNDRDWSTTMSHWYDDPKKHSNDENFILPIVNKIIDTTEDTINAN
jgi:hypothetical protein